MNDSYRDNYGTLQNRYAGRPQGGASAMSIGSICCAIISIFCILTGFFAVMLGSLAVLLSFLSKGRNSRLERPAFIGRIIGIAAAVIGAIMIIYSFAVVINQYGSIDSFYDSYIEAIEETYGADYV